MKMSVEMLVKEKTIKKEILDSLDLLMLRIDGYDVEDKLYEKIKNVTALDSERGMKLKAIIEKPK